MRATKETAAGRKYLDLQREARRTTRPTDELIQLYALECLLDRLTRSEFAQNFVLKGGVLPTGNGSGGENSYRHRQGSRQHQVARFRRHLHVGATASH